MLLLLQVCWFTSRNASVKRLVMFDSKITKHSGADMRPPLVVRATTINLLFCLTERNPSGLGFMSAQYLQRVNKKNYIAVLDCVAPNKTGQHIKTKRADSQDRALGLPNQPSSFWHFFLTKKECLGWRSCEAGEARRAFPCRQIHNSTFNNGRWNEKPKKIKTWT